MYIFIFICTYERKTKGYVLLHTYSIWKMATQGITRRIFFASPSGPATVRARTMAKRSVFISTRAFSPSSSARARFIYNARRAPSIKREPDALWNGNVPFSFFTSDTLVRPYLYRYIRIHEI